MAVNQNLVNLFQLFAVAFRAPAKGPWVESLTTGSLSNDLQATWRALELPEEPLQAFSSALKEYEDKDTDEVLHALRIEETRLFIGENPLIENSEGTWLQREHDVKQPIRMINNHSVAVADFMKECGVKRQEGYNDCIDYLENECDFCGYLASEPEQLLSEDIDPLEKLDTFIGEHLCAWVPGFCDDVIKVTKAPYYRGICTLMKAFLIEE